MQSHATRSIVASLVTLLILGLPLSRAAAQQPQPQTFLKTIAGFSDGDLSDLDKGQVVVNLLKSPDNQDVAAIGSVRIKGSADAGIDAFRNIVSWKKGAGIASVGKFGNPPQAADFQALSMDPKDFQDLKNCKPGDCKSKFSAAEIARIKAIDLGAPEAKSQVDALQREILAEEGKAYLTGGMPTLPPYADKSKPQDRAAAFQSLLGNSQWLMEYLPALDTYLGGYPNASLPNHEDLFVWSQEKFGLKPVTRLTHLIILTRESAPGVKAYAIAQKHIYNNHYFQAGLEMAAIRPDGQGGFYLTGLTRYRTDPATGMMAGAIRGQIRDGVKGNLQNNLERIQKRLQTGNSGAM